MPYIDKRRREKIDEHIDLLARTIFLMADLADLTSADGDLNYTITRLIHSVLNLKEAPKYHKINAAVGVLECAKLELYRRLAGPYEDEKCKINGDV